jgi:hypothetical protein
VCVCACACVCVCVFACVKMNYTVDVAASGCMLLYIPFVANSALPNDQIACCESQQVEHITSYKHTKNT